MGLAAAKSMLVPREYYFEGFENQSVNNCSVTQLFSGFENLYFLSFILFVGY